MDRRRFLQTAFAVGWSFPWDPRVGAWWKPAPKPAPKPVPPPPPPAPTPAPIPPPRAAPYQKGVGLWYASNRAASEAKLASALEEGLWAAPQLAAYPTTGIRTLYVIGVECKPDATDTLQSASCVTYQEAHANGWIATKAGAEIKCATVPTDPAWLGDLGNPAYQDRCAANIVKKLQANPATNAVYIDNVDGSVTQNTGGPIPDKYGTDDAWRTQAVLPWLINVIRKVRLTLPDVYVFANCGDYPLPGEYYDGGDSQWRWWGQIADAEKAQGIVRGLDGLYCEYFMQAPQVGDPAIDNMPRPDKTGAWQWNGAGWQRLVARAQQLGKDFHGLTYSNGGTAERYGRGCFLLDADLTRKSTLWTWSLADPKLTLDTGGPALGARYKVGLLDARSYPAFTVYVNMTTTAQTANGVTVSALDTVFAAR